jgi:hypothetical protein
MVDQPTRRVTSPSISFASGDRAHAKILCIRTEADVFPTALDRGLNVISRFASFQAGEKVRLKRSNAADDEDQALRQLLHVRR